MANTVKVYTRQSGTRRYRPATNAHYPLGTLFVIRYKDRQTGKRIWQNLPGITTFGEAKNVALLKQIELFKVTAPPPPPPKPPAATPVPKRVALAEKDTLGRAIDLYLANARKLRRKGTVFMYELTLKQFYKSCGGKPLAAISKQDLVDFVDYLKKLPFWKRTGNSDSTIKNKIVIVTSLLRANGILNVRLRVSATPAPALSFHPEMLKKLLAIARPEERLLYLFFVSTGCREAEVVNARWDALDFVDKCFRIRKTDDLIQKIINAELCHCLIFFWRN